MLPRPPSSTLFPYTTLFRSHRQEVVVVDLAKKTTQVLERSDFDRISGLAWSPDGKWLAYGIATTAHTSCLDRKSTRLNSSHRTISYAVFCLKKKKKKNSQTNFATQLNTFSLLMIISF